MASTIGSLAMTLSANASALFGVLGRAKAGVMDFSKDTQRVFNKAFSFNPATVLGDIASFLGGTTFTGQIREQIDSLAQLSRQAERTGLSFDEFMAIRKAAGQVGISGEAVTAGFSIFQRKLGEARQQVATGIPIAPTTMGVGGELIPGTKGSTEAFQELGLTLQDIAQGSSLDVFLLAAERLGGIRDAAIQSSLGMQIFGRQWQALAPLIRGGNIREAVTKNLGTYDALDAIKVQQASAAMVRLERSLTPLKQRLAIEMSPVIASLAGGIADAVKDAGGFDAVFRGIADAIAQGALALLDFLDVLDKLATKLGGWEKMLKTLEGWQKRFLPSPQETVTNIAKALGVDVSQVPGLSGPEGGGKRSELGKWIDKRTKEIKNFAETVKKPAAATTVDAAAVQRQQAIGKLTQSLSEQVGAYGRAGAALEIWRMQNMGASDAELVGVRQLEMMRDRLDRITGQAMPGLNIFDTYTTRVQALSQALTEMPGAAEGVQGAMQKLNQQLQDQVTSRAWELTAAAKTPLDKFRSDYDEANELLKRHAISQKVYEATVTSAFQGLDKGTEQLKGPELMTQGSREAASAIIKFQSSGESIQERTRRVLLQSLEANKRTAKAAEDTAEALKNLNIAEIPK